MAVAGCESAEPEVGSSRPPIVIPECEFEVLEIGPDDPVGPYTPRELATQLSGDYRILITWINTSQHDEVPFSLAVQADSAILKKPINAACYKPLTYLISYDFLEQETLSTDHLIFAPVRDDFPRMKHSLRTTLVPESSFPPEVSAPNFAERGWTLDHIELGVRWYPSPEGTVGQGKITGWYRRLDGESSITSAALGLAAIYPEASFPSPKKESNDPDEE